MKFVLIVFAILALAGSGRAYAGSCSCSGGAPTAQLQGAAGTHVERSSSVHVEHHRSGGRAATIRANMAADRAARQAKRSAKLDANAARLASAASTKRTVTRTTEFHTAAVNDCPQPVPPPLPQAQRAPCADIVPKPCLD
ncbi:MAG TPA: hypothetical protein VGG64_08885 [Pirellulales bacterium]|jgi:sRNA-binding protein